MTSTMPGSIALGVGVLMVALGCLGALAMVGSTLMGKHPLPIVHAAGVAGFVCLGMALLALADTMSLGRAESADLFAVPFVALAAGAWWGLARRYRR